MRDRTLPSPVSPRPSAPLRADTSAAAYLAFEEGEKGTLEVGKLADLCLLSANPLAVEPDAIRDIRVLGTYLGGRRVGTSSHA